jgi:hypothetical protein
MSSDEESPLNPEDTPIEDLKQDLKPGLVDESDVPDTEAEAQDGFELQLEQTLRETEEAVLNLEQVHRDPDATALWNAAGSVVCSFKPAPWFIWRLANFVLGRSDQIGEISEGLVFGLRRFLFAVGSDPVLGSGEKVNSVRRALQVVPHDVIAAAAVIYAVCRKLATKEHERIWKPILDDALLRAQIGYHLGTSVEEFGGGRGMLAGFAGRVGLTVLIANGDLDDARRALELLATGKSIREAGLLVYATDPLQVSAMLLTAVGISRDAAFGTASFSVDPDFPPIATQSQRRWFTAFQIIEYVRMGEAQKISADSWELFHCGDEAQEKILERAKLIIRRGHGWQWLLT